MLLCLVFLITGGFFLPASSSFELRDLLPGQRVILLSTSSTQPEHAYQIWAFADQGIEMVFSHFTENMNLHLSGGELEIIARSSTQLIALMHAPRDQYVQFWVSGDASVDQCMLQWKYERPHQAFLEFARMYANYAHPWHRRFYLDFYLSPISSNERRYPNHHYYVAYPVDLGAPYSWGGKQSLTTIHQKILKNGPVDHWMEYYYNKDVMHPVNLDAYESCFDYIPGPENPIYWAGVDCSGLLEICSHMAGLLYSWRDAKVISKGDYRSASNFFDIRPGDIFILLRNGIVVHFGVVSKVGSTISSSYIIHSAWFTSYRYNTNALLKVAETSMAEFSSCYTWEIRRYHVQN